MLLSIVLDAAFCERTAMTSAPGYVDRFAKGVVPVRVLMPQALAGGDAMKPRASLILPPSIRKYSALRKLAPAFGSQSWRTNASLPLTQSLSI